MVECIPACCNRSFLLCFSSANSIRLLMTLAREVDSREWLRDREVRFGCVSQHQLTHRAAHYSFWAPATNVHSQELIPFLRNPTVRPEALNMHSEFRKCIATAATKNPAHARGGPSGCCALSITRSLFLPPCTAEYFMRSRNSCSASLFKSRKGLCRC